MNNCECGKGRGTFPRTLTGKPGWAQLLPNTCDELKPRELIMSTDHESVQSDLCYV